MNQVMSTVGVAQRILRDSIVVFLYHEVSDSPSPFNKMFGLNVPPAVFSDQLDLIGRSFEFIDPKRLLSGNHRTPAALVTFDDGNLSYFRTALPILKEKQIPSVMFVNFGSILGEVCWSGLVTFLQYCDPDFYRQKNPKDGDFLRFTEPEVSSYLSSVKADALLGRVRSFRGAIAEARDIEDVSEEPLVYLGNHLYNHYNVTTLTADRVRKEYWENQRLIDSHPRGMRAFSYPFGQPMTCYNKETSQLIQGEGAEALFSAYPLPNFRQDGKFYHRVPMTEAVRGEMDLYRSIMSNFVRGKLRIGPESRV